ncbi:MAG: hypothetical protein IT361_01790 [Gemmatimonadaceae bacterium]|nr:hypothetical protein [Gemmatimonadaceae bacterium]
MIETRELDERLRAHYTRQQALDAARAPAFDAMLAAARASDERVPVLPERWSRRRVLVWAAPFVAAAGLAAILVVPERLKNREFDRTVEEWSRLESSLHSPTDGLLSVPGSEFIGRGLSLPGTSNRRGS